MFSSLRNLWCEDQALLLWRFCWGCWNLHTSYIIILEFYSFWWWQNHAYNDYKYEDDCLCLCRDFCSHWIRSEGILPPLLVKTIKLQCSGCSPWKVQIQYDLDLGHVGAQFWVSSICAFLFLIWPARCAPGYPCLPKWSLLWSTRSRSCFARSCCSTKCWPPWWSNWPPLWSRW